MLEAGRVGGVTGDGDVHALVLHDRNALEDVVCAVALNRCALAVGERLLFDNLQLVVEEVVIGLHIGEAVDSGDDVGSVLAQAVQDDAERLFAGAVRCLGNADCAFCGSEGLVACEERKALGLVAEQTGAQVAVAQADLAVLRNGTRNTERLQANADGLGSVRSGIAALLQSDCAAQGICPAGVLKRDGLYTLDNFIYIDSLAQAKVARFLEAGKAILGKALFDFGHSSFFTFKLDIVSHVSCPPLFCFLGCLPDWETPDLECSV